MSPFTVSINATEPIKVSYHPSKFGDHMLCGRGDIRLVLILHDHVIKGHVTLWVGGSDGNLPSLMAIGIVVVEM